MQLHELLSPALLVYPEIIQRNIDSMIRVAGSPGRLRPHCKTHKMREIIAMQLERGVLKHKCATLMEAEMLADCGVTDVLLAYNVVGPNVQRVVRILKKYPDLHFACTGDHAAPVSELGAAVQAIGRTVDVLLDVDVGMHRTGVAAGPGAVDLYRTFSTTLGIRPGGLHIYDGHNHQHDLAERRTAASEAWRIATFFRDELEQAGLPVPRLVCGGTPTFPVFAEIQDRALELSPGTVILHDAGYGQNYPDLPFEPAAKLLTRVISKPGPNRLTVDLGHKAVAGDPPAGRRAFFPALPSAKAVMHSEEHLVLETPEADRFQPGDMLLAIPIHVCPTCALHKEAYVMSGDEVIGVWQVASRDRV